MTCFLSRYAEVFLFFLVVVLFLYVVLLVEILDVEPQELNKKAKKANNNKVFGTFFNIETVL